MKHINLSLLILLVLFTIACGGGSKNMQPVPTPPPPTPPAPTLNLTGTWQGDLVGVNFSGSNANILLVGSAPTTLQQVALDIDCGGHSVGFTAIMPVTTSGTSFSLSYVDPSTTVILSGTQDAPTHIGGQVKFSQAPCGTPVNPWVANWSANLQQ